MTRSSTPPHADFHGSDTFTYRASDSVLTSADATVVVTVSPVNDPPQFGAADTERTIVAHAASGTEVGEPVKARDPDGDSLIYTLTGTGAVSFDIDRYTGQITVAVGTVLDSSIEPSYTVTVTAEDPSPATAAIDVTITVIPSTNQWSSPRVAGHFHKERV